MTPPLKFNEEASQHAYKTWGANCGPHALAAATGRSLHDVRPVLVGFDLKRYTNPTMMENALNLMGVDWRRSRGLKLKAQPTSHLSSLARVQWEGRWLNPGVPKVVSYRHTHWIAYFQGQVFCTVVPFFGWVPFDRWAEYLDRWTKANGYDGWHITHFYELSK